MQKIWHYSNSILFLLGRRRYIIPWLILAFLLSSLFEVIGIGLIAPYVALIINPDSFLTNQNFSFLISFMPFTSNDSLIIIFGLLLVLAFFLKTIGVILINYLIIKFSYNQEVKVRTFLMKSYQLMSYDRTECLILE